MPKPPKEQQVLIQEVKLIKDPSGENQASKTRAFKNFITSKEINRDYNDQSAESFPIPASFSASKVSLNKKQSLRPDQSEQSPFITHSRVHSFNKTHMLSDYKYGTDEYEDALQKMLSQTDQRTMSRDRMQQQIRDKIFEWSIKRRNNQSRFTFKLESMDNSQFQKLGVQSMRTHLQATIAGPRFRRNQNSKTDDN